MTRYFSHYAIIYPFAFLKNQVVELDEEGHLMSYIPFEIEQQNTIYYSGLLVFKPRQLDLSMIDIERLWAEKKMDQLEKITKRSSMDLRNQPEQYEVLHLP